MIDVKGGDRTLLYGYTAGRDSWHAYLRNGMICLLEYREGDGPDIRTLRYAENVSWDPIGLVPSKRVYPESCDAHFARLLLDRGISLRYTGFSDSRYERVKGRQFHGVIMGDEKEEVIEGWSD